MLTAVPIAASTPADDAPRAATRSVPGGVSRSGRERLAFAAGVVGLTTLFALVYVLRLGMGAAERGASFDWGHELAKVLVHWWASLPFVPLLAWLVRRAPLMREHWARNAAILIAGTFVASVGRSLLDSPLLQLFGDPPLPLLRSTRVFAAFGSFLAVTGMLHAVHFYQEMRAREREAARLARSLAEERLAATEARLAALRAQLQPHFLFNALNGIAALLHHEPLVADRMLTRLAELLRSVLNAPSAEEHPLREELQVLDQYLDVMRLRFGPRLTIQRDVDPSTLDAGVPWLVLQPLVENALEHGLWPRSGPGTLRLEASRANDQLRLVVEDDGVGLRGDAADGIGIANTRRRLVHLHGDSASLVLGPRDGGGTRTVVTMPLRAATSGASRGE